MWSSPSKATNLAVSFPMAHLVERSSFDAPTETHHGTPLSGSLTYKYDLMENHTPRGKRKQVCTWSRL